ncbi:Transducin beta-like protein, partial [Thalictrum thalictroides]
GACPFEQKASDATVTDKDDAKKGFTLAVMLPLDQGLLCVTSDEQFLFYSPIQSLENTFELMLRKRLVGNSEEIVDMMLLGDEEQFLAVATKVEQVQVYDLASMSCSYVLAGHTATVLSLDTCVSTSGRTLLVTGSKDNNVRLWDQEGHCWIGVGTGHLGDVEAVAFSKKKRNIIVSGSSDHTLKVWSLDGLMEDGKLPINLKSKAVVAAHDKDINSVAFAPNDSYDRTACVWRLPDLVSIVVLRGHKKGIWSVEFSPIDQCVITASDDKTIKLWPISDDADCLVKLWAVRANECIATYDQHEHKVWALAVGKKTEMLATGGGDTVSLWHDSTGADKEEEFRREEEGVLKGQELENAVSDADYARAIRFAFELCRPHKLFNIFSDLCRKVHADDQVDKALRTLQKEEIHLLFETRNRNSVILLNLCFSGFSTSFLRCWKLRLIRSTLLLDYTLSAMSVIEPESEVQASKEISLLQHEEVYKPGVDDVSQNLEASTEDSLGDDKREEIVKEKEIR